MVIYEDAYIIAVNKPNNMLVHHSSMSRNIANETNVLQYLKRNYNTKYFPVHRLDRKTSGVILLAKESKFVSKFQNLFVTNQIQKTYHGIVRGFVNTTVIASDVKGRDSNVYKTALTELKTLKTTTVDIPVTPYKTSRYSLVELTPKTGRLHQLRIHLNKINHPLIGDPKYGDRFHNRMFRTKFNCPNLFLHAIKIEFTHPFTHQRVNIEAELPKDWVIIKNQFKW